jgi:hypothetical protein
MKVARQNVDRARKITAPFATASGRDDGKTPRKNVRGRVRILRNKSLS